MFDKILGLRYIYLIAVVITFINSLFFLFLGVRYAWHGYEDIILQHSEARPGLHFLESLDMFMISLVFSIFSFGMMRIFTHYHVKHDSLPGWLQVTTFSELKEVLWETILLTLVILCVTEVVQHTGQFTWKVFILPGVILLLSGSLVFIRYGKRNH